MLLNNTFKIIKGTTTLFGGKKTVSTVLYDFKMNNEKIDKKYLIFLMDHIKDNLEIRKFDIKTKNQHYLKQSVQNKWKEKIIIHNKNNNIYSGFELINETKFSTEKIGTSNHTFTYFGESYITYNENGIVTLIEDAICALENDNIKSLNPFFSKIVSFFCNDSLYHRLQKIESFSKDITKYMLDNSNNNIEINVDNFLKNLINHQENKIYVYNSEEPVFSLNNEWSTKINLYQESWDSINIIPLSPNTSILISESDSKLSKIKSKFKNLEINKKLALFLLLNSIINEMERLYDLEKEHGQVINNYFKNTIIGIPDKETYNLIKKKIPIEEIYDSFSKEDLEQFIFMLIQKT